MPSLARHKAEGRPEVIPLFKQLVGLGSSPANDIQVRGEGIEPFHAQLIFDGRDFHMQEVGRAGLLRVNDKRRRRTKIFHGDKIAVGNEEFSFSIFGEPVEGLGDAEANLRLRAELDGMARLAEFSRTLATSPSIEAQLGAMLDQLMELYHASKAFVVLLDGEEARVSVSRQAGTAQANLAIPALSDSIIQHVIKTQEPLIVSDALSDDSFSSSQSVIDMRLSSVMCVPMLASGRLLGLLYLGNDSVVNLFEASNLDTLRVYASQAALLVQNALLMDQLVNDRQELAEQLNSRKFGDIIGSSPVVQEVFRRVARVAETDVSVLVTGETGTGKELVARELHRRSKRAKGPFVVVNCGAIPENLIESELFGHVKGAFTGAIATRDGRFQAAKSGTLFLDEVGELPVAMQVKLLRALQEREVTKVGDHRSEPVDIRIVSATNRDLKEEMARGAFREDLYYRLNVVHVELPALRDRGDDVVLLAKYFLAKYAGEFASPVRGFSATALRAMRRYGWPGNIRQLENRIKRAVVMAEAALLSPEDLDLSSSQEAPMMPLHQARETFQRDYVLRALERNNGNRTKAAKDLGVDPRTIFRYLERDRPSEETTGPAKEIVEDMSRWT